MDNQENQAQKFAKRIIGILGEHHHRVRERRALIVIFLVVFSSFMAYQFYFAKV